MSTDLVLEIERATSHVRSRAEKDPRRFLVPVGRALYGAIFILAAAGHFSKQTIDLAASQGVPLAAITVPFSGLLSLAGGASILLGYRARLGAALLALFLVPVTLSMHAFWAASDPAAAQLHQIMFMKNVSMLGGALLIAWFGAGPVSFDARREGRAA